MAGRSRIALAVGTLCLWLSTGSAGAQPWLDLPVGQVITLAGPIEAGSGGIEVDELGNVYTADFGQSLSSGPMGTRVWKVTPEGEVSVLAEGFRGASGNVIGPDGAFYQANIAGNTISRIGPDGALETVVSSGLFNPVGITFGADGHLMVANCGRHQIARVNDAGVAEVFSDSSLLRCPNGLVTGPEGALYASNFYNGNVVRIDTSGEASVLTTLPGNNLGHLVFHEDRFYVVARTAHQIYEVSLTGEATLVIGSGDHGIEDGPALEASLSFPNDVGLSPDGRVIYWNDVSAIVEDGGQTLAPTVVRMMRLR